MPHFRFLRIVEHDVLPRYRLDDLCALVPEQRGHFLNGGGSYRRGGDGAFLGVRAA